MQYTTLYCSWRIILVDPPTQKNDLSEKSQTLFGIYIFYIFAPPTRLSIFILFKKEGSAIALSLFWKCLFFFFFKCSSNKFNWRMSCLCTVFLFCVSPLVGEKGGGREKFRLNTRLWFTISLKSRAFVKFFKVGLGGWKGKKNVSNAHLSGVCVSLLRCAV